MVLELSAQKLSAARASDSRTGESPAAGNDTLTRTQLTCKVILFDDEEHTYDYVVEMLTMCAGLSREAAFYCALEVDLTGRTIVYHGEFDSCKTVCDKILSYGPDHRLLKSRSSMEAEVQRY